MEVSNLLSSSSLLKFLIFSLIEILSPSTLKARKEVFDFKSLNLNTEFFFFKKSSSFDLLGTYTAPDISLLEPDNLINKSKISSNLSI